MKSSNFYFRIVLFSLLTISFSCSSIRFLHKNAEIGNNHGIIWLLDRGTDINAKNENGETPLMIAIRYRQFETIRLLLDRGADISAKDSDGRTLLMIASESGLFETVKILLDAGLEISATDNEGKTALMYGVWSYDIAKFLIENGASIHQKDNNENIALAWALKYAAKESVILILQNGASLNLSMDETIVCVDSKIICNVASITNIDNQIIDNKSIIYQTLSKGFHSIEVKIGDLCRHVNYVVKYSHPSPFIPRYYYKKPCFTNFSYDFEGGYIYFIEFESCKRNAFNTIDELKLEDINLFKEN